MKKISTVLIIIFIFISCGCARTVKDLKADPSGSYSFSIKLNYEKVYRISTQYLEDNALASSIKSRIYHQKKEAIVYNIHAPSNPLTRNIYLACEMKAISDNETSVDIYYHIATWKSEALSLKNEILSHGYE